MYLPAHFSDPVQAAVLLDAAERGFGHLVVTGANGPCATPLPFLIDTGSPVIVRAHLARPNPVWRHAPCTALIIVAGADAYVSPSLYPSKAEHGKVVPTWNYEVIHLRGELRVHDDAEWVEQQVRDLTARHERDRSAPWSIDDAPRDYVDKMLRSIVGIELVIDCVDGKRKLSQNRPADDFEAVRCAFGDDPAAMAVAAAMNRVAAVEGGR